MNAKEYKEYQQDVADFFEREGITNLTGTYDEETGEGSMEPFFSWSPCHCCGTTLGGDREECAGWNPTLEEVQTYSAVCMDCVYYAEYGRLDDMTMLDIEKSEREETSKAQACERSDLEKPSDYPQDYNSAAQDLMNF